MEGVAVICMQQSGCDRAMQNINHYININHSVNISGVRLKTLIYCLNIYAQLCMLGIAKSELQPNC